MIDSWQIIYLFNCLGMILTVLHSPQFIRIASVTATMLYDAEEQNDILLYFSSATFTPTPVRGQRHSEFKTPRRWRERRQERRREREAMGQSQVSSCLCSRQMSTHLITTPGGHRTAGSAMFITYRLFPSNSNYQSFVDRQEHTVKLRRVSQQ